MKNIFHQPITGTFELVSLLLVVAVFSGIPEVFRSETNVSVDVVDHFLRSRGRVILRQFSAVASLVFLALLGWAIIAPAHDTIVYPQNTQELYIPLFLYWVPILAGTFLSIISAALALRHNRRNDPSRD